MRTCGQIAYEAYGANRDWKSVSGAPMPGWAEQRPEISAAWEAAAAAPIAGILDRIKRLRETMDWMSQTVHRAHHEGPLETCGKSTCQAARDVLAERAGAPDDLTVTEWEQLAADCGMTSDTETRDEFVARVKQIIAQASEAAGNLDRIKRLRHVLWTITTESGYRSKEIAGAALAETAGAEGTGDGAKYDHCHVVCRAATLDGIRCPDDSCDVEDGSRKAPQPAAGHEAGRTGLLPCPWCGREPTLERPHPGMSRVYCHNFRCFAHADTAWCEDSETPASVIWNTRVPAVQPAAVTISDDVFAAVVRTTPSSWYKPCEQKRWRTLIDAALQGDAALAAAVAVRPEC